MTDIRAKNRSRDHPTPPLSASRADGDCRRDDDSIGGGGGGGGGGCVGWGGGGRVSAAAPKLIIGDSFAGQEEPLY